MLDRLSREIAVVQHSTETEAVKEIESQFAMGPRLAPRLTTRSLKADAEGDDAAVEDEAA